MFYFLIILITMLFFFAVAFFALFSMRSEAPEYEEGLGFSHITYSLETMLEMGFFGEYDVAGFDGTASPHMARTLFMVFMLVFFVTALNALIAILGDSFDQAQQARLASRTRQRAEIIVEFYHWKKGTNTKEFLTIQEEVKWIHRLQPEIMHSQGDTEWRGRVEAIHNRVSKDVKRENRRLRADMEKKNRELRNDIKHMRKDIKTLIASRAAERSGPRKVATVSKVVHFSSRMLAKQRSSGSRVAADAQDASQDQAPHAAVVPPLGSPRS